MNQSVSKLGMLCLIILSLGFFRDSKTKKLLISTGPDVAEVLRGYFPQNAIQGNQSVGYDLVTIPEDRLDFVSRLVHEKFNRCGGFMVEESPEKAEKSWFHTQRAESSRMTSIKYEIENDTAVNAAMGLANERRVLDTIKSLSKYKNRYYKSKTGIDSQNWILKRWEEIAKAIPEISVSKFTHQNFPQPSIILTWQGENKKDEQVVVGGHGDSISGWFPSSNIDAPGADDNASGIATITEALSVLAESKFKPTRTIKLISYAAEEVGLRGSNDIAQTAKSNGDHIIGVLQLDMTNFSDSQNDIVIMSDYTNTAQNKFLQRLLDFYQPELTWIESTCGYACSDHASWTKQGYPASFPFEATMDTHNPHIHSKEDTIDKSDGSANHAMPFVKLTLGFLIELAS